MKREIKLIKFIEIRYADPISSMDLTNDYLLFGTMLGATKLFKINKQELISLSEVQDEYVSGVKINENKLYICVGDLKIFQYNLGDNEDLSSPDKEILNYEDTKIHEEKCDNCLSMLCENFLVRTYIESQKKKDKDKEENKLNEKEVFFKNIYVDDDENKIFRRVKMYDYSVPFDYDGVNYIFIDFVSQNHRNFNIYDVNSKEMKLNVEIDTFNNEKIGHISHLKIINNDLIFIVRDFNICELRNFKFELVKKLNVKASEILAFDVLYYENVEEKNVDNNNSTNTDIKEKESAKDKEINCIAFLDIDCNVFLYNYKEDKNELLFNLDKDNLGIDDDIKGQGFFIFNYPYYIKISKKYIAISSDYGCILIQYNKN